MELRITSIALTVLINIATSVVASEEKMTMGNPAPAFTLTGSDGKEHSLANFKENKAVVLAWFPKAFTGG